MPGCLLYVAAKKLLSQKQREGGRVVGGGGEVLAKGYQISVRGAMSPWATSYNLVTTGQVSILEKGQAWH